MAIEDPTVTPDELPPINEQAAWVEHLPALVTGVLVKGNDDGQGPSNFQARVLDARTRFLKTLIEGLSSGGIILKGHLDTQAELDAIDTTNLQVGTAYFLDFALRVWNGTIWGDSGSLRGERGINLLGTWPDNLDLPQRTENKVGDAYIWRHDVHVLVPEPGEWEALGIRGPDGKDTYEIWKEQPGNENGTVAQFLAAQKGDPGDDAYVTWSKLPGNEGKSEAEWVIAMTGKQGDEGPARAPFAVAGSKTSSAQLPQPGNPEEAWYVGIDLYVWVAADNSYSMIPGIGGKSAFLLWKDIPGNEDKTEADFWLSLKGEKGDNVKGDPGKDGRNLRVLGTVATSADLSAIVNPKDQDAYTALDTGRLWMYLPDEGGWKDLGPFRGVDGKSAYEVWQDDGHTGESLAAFWTFLRGKDGKSINITGAVNTRTDLPANPKDQDLYAVRDEHSFYAFVDGAWLNLGTFGQDGKDGVDGKSLDIIKILTDSDNVPPVADDTNLGKAYLDLDKIVWVNIQKVWQNAGKFQGNQGEIGPIGISIKPRGTVATIAALPAIGTVAEGDLWYVADTKLGYCKVDGQWSDPIDNIGPQGNQGVQGNPGALMPIKGTYQTLALLIAAHPTGALGDAYLIVDNTANPQVRNLAIWSVEQNAWIDTGPAGIPGQKGDPGQGLPGLPGDKGEKGSQWLTLNTHDAPSNVFNGRTGDWAVNLDFKVFYKTVDQGWVQWGQLVAGDVNSPLPSLGKVVRQGTFWVPVPVDEVPNMVAGHVYGRGLVGGVGGWIDIPASIADVTTKNGKPYVRVWETNGSAPYWKELVIPVSGIPEAPSVQGKTYLRDGFAAAWVEFIRGLMPPSGGVDGIQRLFLNGDWARLDRVDYPILNVSATASVDPAVTQFVIVNNSASTTKTITLGDGPKNAAARGMPLTMLVLGSTGVVNFVATGSTSLTWDRGTPPNIVGSRSVIVFLWSGTEWVGAGGAAVP